MVASVSASDPDSDTLSFAWELHGEVAKPGIGGDPEKAPTQHTQAVRSSDGPTATIVLPSEPGKYRLYVYVRDGKGSATTANVPLLVATDAVPATPPTAAAVAAPTDQSPRRATLPLVVYAEVDSRPVYVPSGWMGDTASIKLDPNCAEQPHAGKTCVRVDYSNPGEFGGVVWQDPANDWGDVDGGYDLSGAKRLSFWARGAAGGEKVEFKFGVLGPEKSFPDSGSGAIVVELTNEWKQYEIDISSADLSRIKTGFCWVAAGQGKPIRFFLDNIQYSAE
jgi:hypothetical protein